ncbi:hypothetical protein [Thermotoga sp.]|uniref:hypothetical protein n=1 Tax=Thermotoga sp. TaxID=28240 RepID=UPI0025D6476B|nr:hypothetical protein [Thermotoga sp.]MCD6550680.1 hypothetical protein [Thermotoga sp.]
MGEIEARNELAITQKDIEEVAQQYRLFLDLQRSILTPNVDYGFPSRKQPDWKGANRAFTRQEQKNWQRYSSST